ncbi:MAG TPA: hypothetical protein VNK46_07670 [Nitrospiraceae bacterium]|jgi:catechol 2,3-dioxygenase-like lactoylglutathione lyase family enzyme|nr:hypothetical protein [Nitrospiraceae bacterium]
MATQVKPIPTGYHSVTPMLTVLDTNKAIDFYKRALGAEERAQFIEPAANPAIPPIGEFSADGYSSPG